MHDPSQIAERRDALEHLAKSGFAPLLQVLADPRVYTRGGSGRLIVSTVARRLRMSPRRVAAMLVNARAALLQ